MKYEIVEFKNEDINFNYKFFGIRRRNLIQNFFNFGGDYYDFHNDGMRNYFWKSDSVFFNDCKIKDISLLFYTHSKLTNNVVEKIIK